MAIKRSQADGLDAGYDGIDRFHPPEWLGIDVGGHELAALYARARLFVSAFQPSFKLAEKERDGAPVRKRYHAPATPCDRLLADPRTSTEVRRRIEVLRSDLDPV